MRCYSRGAVGAGRAPRRVFTAEPAEPQRRQRCPCPLPVPVRARCPQPQCQEETRVCKRRHGRSGAPGGQGFPGLAARSPCPPGHPRCCASPPGTDPRGSPGIAEPVGNGGRLYKAEAMPLGEVRGQAPAG